MSLSDLRQIVDRIQADETWKHKRQFLQVIKYWESVVGDNVAAQTRPSGIYRQVLQVAVSSSVWSQALVFQRRSILAKLNPLLIGSASPLIDIHFSTAKWASLPPKATKTEAIDPAKASEPTELMQKHPSFVRSPQLRVKTSAPAPETAIEAFLRWSNAIKQSTAHLPKCPCCNCATPLGELNRWQMCRTCARQRFLYFNTTPEEESQEHPNRLPKDPR
jgi:predicted nucleic acid-binding Zn ribbon protein